MFAKLLNITIDTLGASEQSSWFCDTCSGHMSRGGMWFMERSKTGSSPCTVALISSFASNIFTWTILQTTCPTFPELTIFPPLITPSPMTSLLVFQMTRPIPGRPGLQYQRCFISFSPCHLSGFIPSFLLPSLFATWLYFFWIHQTVPPTMMSQFPETLFYPHFSTPPVIFFLNESSSNFLSWHSKPLHFLSSQHTLLLWALLPTQWLNVSPCQSSFTRNYDFGTSQHSTLSFRYQSNVRP